MTRQICVEYGPVGIRANAIAPGAIATPLFEQVVKDSPDPEEMIQRLAILHPLDPRANQKRLPPWRHFCSLVRPRSCPVK